MKFIKSSLISAFLAFKSVRADAESDAESQYVVPVVREMVIDKMINTFQATGLKNYK